MKKYILILFLFCCFSSYAQNTISSYKYVIVPEKFSFSKEDNEYSLNSLFKALLEYKGFKVYYGNDQLPADVAKDRCSALSADLQKKGGIFSTSITIVLKDCHNNIIFKSKEGVSREKDLKVAHNAALRDAFKTLDETPYAYTESTQALAQSVSAVAPVITPVKPAEALKEQVVTLYAQPIANGYQLIDTAPKIILTLLKTSEENYFIANSATTNGIVLKKKGDWFFEYYKDGKLVSEQLQVKF